MQNQIENFSIIKPNSQCKIEKRLESEINKTSNIIKISLDSKDIPSPISTKTNKYKKHFLFGSRNLNNINYNNLLTIPYNNIDNSNSTYLYLSRPKSNFYLLNKHKENFNINNFLSHRGSDNNSYRFFYSI